MSAWARVDFQELAQKVMQSQCGPADLSIWGGRCAEGDLPEFLRQWDDLVEMPHRVWEHASEITFEKDTPPQNVALLERARLFGPGGDLTLRRNEAAFDWYFVGRAEVHPPPGNYGVQDYWAGHQDVMFHLHNETALLWGERKGGQARWTDVRVAAAELNYPVPAGCKRVQVHYKTFSRAGRMEFVWFTGLSEWKEADNG